MSRVWEYFLLDVSYQGRVLLMMPLNVSALAVNFAGACRAFPPLSSVFLTNSKVPLVLDCAKSQSFGGAQLNPT